MCIYYNKISVDFSRLGHSGAEFLLQERTLILKKDARLDKKIKKTDGTYGPSVFSEVFKAQTSGMVLRIFSGMTTIICYLNNVKR